MDKAVAQELVALAVKILQSDGRIEGEVQTDVYGCKHVSVRAFSTEVRVDMDINISPCVESRLGL